MSAQHALQLREDPDQGVAGRGLGRLAVPCPAGLEQRVGPAAQSRERLGVAAEVEDVALDADALVLERAQEPRPLGAGVAGVAERPEGTEIGVEVAGAERALHLVACGFHRREGRVGDPLGAGAGEEGLETEAKRLDLLELLDGERGDARAAARDADDEPFALEPTQRVADGRQADVEPARPPPRGEGARPARARGGRSPGEGCDRRRPRRTRSREERRSRQASVDL